MGIAEMGHQLVWMVWQSIRIVGASACVIFVLHQKIQKMAKCTFWYQLTRVVPDKVQRAVKWLCVCVCYLYCVNISMVLSVGQLRTIMFSRPVLAMSGFFVGMLSFNNMCLKLVGVSFYQVILLKILNLWVFCFAR